MALEDYVESVTLFSGACMLDFVRLSAKAEPGKGEVR
jgi:hypothetical protein